MELIKLSATDSTNSYLKNLCNENEVAHGTVVWADFQSEGRGQKDRKWKSEEGKNLCVSRLHLLNNFPIEDQFTVSCAVALACYNTLKALGIPRLSIKWPNDIMAGSYKICGILIENIVKSKVITKTIVGIGLNINQTSFPGLPWATSMKSLTGNTFSREDVLSVLVEELDRQFKYITRNSGALRSQYEEKLFFLNRPTRYGDGSRNFTGSIRGIDDQGKLLLETDTGIKAYGLQEIRMLPPENT